MLKYNVHILDSLELKGTLFSFFFHNLSEMVGNDNFKFHPITEVSSPMSNDLGISVHICAHSIK